MTTANLDHPAKYSAPVLRQMRALIGQERERRLAVSADAGVSWPGELLVLDPFAGTGKIHELADPGRVDTTGVELEPEWAACHPRTQVGDALKLPRAWSGKFDVVATSPVYGNRMSDHHDARDGSKRYSYRHSLGRMPSPGSSATLAWGAKYRDFHAAAWEQVERVVKADGLFLLNISDYVNNGAIVRAAEWHLGWLCGRGWLVEMVAPVATRRMRNGENRDMRMGFELVAALRRGAVHGGVW